MIWRRVKVVGSIGDILFRFYSLCRHRYGDIAASTPSAVAALMPARISALDGKIPVDPAQALLRARKMAKACFHLQKNPGDGEISLIIITLFRHVGIDDGRQISMRWCRVV